MRVDAGTCLTPLVALGAPRANPSPCKLGIGNRRPELAGGIGLRVRRVPMEMVDVPQAKKDRDFAQSRDRKALSLLIELHALESDDLVGEAVVRLTHYT